MFKAFNPHVDEYMRSNSVNQLRMLKNLLIFISFINKLREYEFLVEVVLNVLNSLMYELLISYQNKIMF